MWHRHVSTSGLVADHDYSINLMWINKDKKSTYPSDLSARLLSWKELHHNINLWYDTVPPKHIDGINLSDIRKLKIVQDNQHIFNENISVYFRVDMLRVAATIHHLDITGDKYFVYADFDMEPMNKQSLFDDETLTKLDNTGIVLAEAKGTMFENSFHIVANNPNVFKAMKIMLLDLNLIRAANALSHKLVMGNTIGTITYLYKSSMSLLSESVFYSYLSMLKYLDTLNGRGSILIVASWDDMKNGTVFDDDEFNYDKHGMKYFDTTSVSQRLGKNLMYRSITGTNFIPTKKVNIPPPKGYYDHVLPYYERPWYYKIAYKLGLF